MAQPRIADTKWEMAKTKGGNAGQLVRPRQASIAEAEGQEVAPIKAPSKKCQK
jgi:hypothetical protein